MLDASVDRAVDAHGGQSRGDLALNGAHKTISLLLMRFQIGHDAVISVRIEIFETGILQLPFNLLHTKTVCQRRVNVHRLAGFGHLLLRSLVFHGAGVMQSVADFDENDTDILAHGHEHLTEVLHLLLFQRGILHTGQLGNALDQGGNRRTKLTGNFIIGRIGIFNAVVQNRAENGIGIQTGFRDDFRNRQRMDDVGRSILAFLIAMLLLRIGDRTVNGLHIGLRTMQRDHALHTFIMIGKGFHSLTSQRMI